LKKKDKLKEAACRFPVQVQEQDVLVDKNLPDRILIAASSK